jgi:pimeloyl-ACP methyl ester carboxylesterase
MPTKYFTVDGVATYVHHRGPTTPPGVPPELSRGEPILCLHGAGGNGAYLDDLLSALATEHSPLAFDQPGHGRSGGLDSLGSIQRMATFTRGVISELGAGAPVLFGHSMGGAVAQRYALENPDGVRALVLCSSGARFEVPTDLVEMVRRVTEGKARRAFTRDAFSPKTPDEVVHRGWREDAKTDPRTNYGDLLACQGWDVNDRLGEIGVPTLVLVGQDEHPPLLEQADVLAAGIPGARKVVVSAAGHALPLEQPRAVAEAVCEFLGETLR